MARHPTDDTKNLPKLDQYPGLSEAMLDTVQLPLLVLNGCLRLIRANAVFFSHFKVTTNDSIGRRLPELGNGQWNIPGLRKLLEEILPKERCASAFYRASLVNSRRRVADRACASKHC